MKHARKHQIIGAPDEVWAALELAHRDGRLISVEAIANITGDDRVTATVWLQASATAENKFDPNVRTTILIGAIVTGLGLIGLFQNFIMQGLAVVITCLIFASIAIAHWQPDRDH